MFKKNIILGIDPGTYHTGYGLILVEGEKMSLIKAGRFSPKPFWPLEKRLNYIYDALFGLVKNNNIEVVAVENIFYAKNVKAALSLGHVRGIILLLASQIKAKLCEYSPTLVKNIVTGYGKADKEQVAFMVKKILDHTDDFAVDASDALAIAICYVNQECNINKLNSVAKNNCKNRNSSNWRSLSYEDIEKISFKGKIK